MDKPLIQVPLAYTSDRAQSLAFSSQRLVNCYVEKGEPGSKSQFAIYGTPGLKPWAEVGSGPIRGQHDMAGVAYVVSGHELYSVNSSGAGTLLGNIGGGTDHVVMADNGDQLAIATGVTGHLYSTLTGLLLPVSASHPGSVAYLNGYFLWTADETFQISALLDGTSYDALDFATAEHSPDKLRRVFVVGPEVWLMGEKTIEPWVNTGALDFPFERMSQTVLNKGIAAKHSPALVDNTVFWVGVEPEAGGGPIVFRAQGYSPQVISTPAIEKILEGVSDLDAVRGFAYKQLGHLFYGLILPDAPALFYNVAMQQWHERVTHETARWLGNNHLSLYGKNLIGSSIDGQIYELDPEHYFDDTATPLVVDMTLPPFGDDSVVKRMGLMRLDMETGVGLSTGQGSAPMVMGRFSTDRGRTFSNELWRSIGPIGEYGRGVEWRRIGPFRSVVWRFQVSDPVKRVFIAAWANIV